MNLHEVEFPLYKMRTYQKIRENLLGRKFIITRKKEYVLDDCSYAGNYAERRLRMKLDGIEDIYPLDIRVEGTEDLVKYPTGTVFIDNTGKLFKYKKTSAKYYPVESRKIIKLVKSDKPYAIRSLIYVDGYDIAFKYHKSIKREKYASVMSTPNGPLLYDLTEEPHKTFKRKI